MTHPPAIEALRIGGFLLFAAMLLSAALSWHWIDLRLGAQLAKAEGKAECFDVVRERMLEREVEEMQVPGVQGDPARGAAEAPVREWER